MVSAGWASELTALWINGIQPLLKPQYVKKTPSYVSSTGAGMWFVLPLDIEPCHSCWFSPFGSFPNIAQCLLDKIRMGDGGHIYSG